MARDLDEAVAAIAERVGPAIVGFGRGWGRGSGVVVAPGRVLTNAQNVAGPDVMVSFSDGRRERGTVSTDPDLDLAAVRVDTGDVRPVEWKPASVGAVVGQPVVALGNRGGRGLRTMLGQVTATDRDVRGPRGRTVTGCIEHSARLPRAAGGGPLFDLDGRLLGLNAVRLDDGRIAAIPAGQELASRAEGLWSETPLRGGVALGLEEAHPLFERIHLLDEEPPYGRDVLQRLGMKGLHVGCGPNVAPGWLNTDQAVFAAADGAVSQPGRIVAGAEDDRYFMSHDAVDRYPFEDGAFDVAYSEHFIEHIPRGAAIDWLREIHRLLRPGGYLRLSTPDLRRYVDGYLDPAGSLFAEHRQVLLQMPLFEDSGVPDTRGFMLNQIFRFFGHRWIYDLDEVRAVAADAGFEPDAVIQCSFRQGRLPEVAEMDKPERSDESLYVEIART